MKISIYLQMNPWNVQDLEEFLYYCCPQCDVKVKECTAFLQHALEMHEDEASQVLVKSETEFETIKNEAEFQSKTCKSGHSEVQCYTCGHIELDKKDLNEHIKDVHNYTKIKDSMFGPPRDFQCQECKLVFISTDALGLHVCGDLPSSWLGKRGTLKNCSHCSASFKENYALLRHIASKHSKQKNFACDQCDYKASLPTLLKKHQLRVHSQRQRSHLCNQCGSLYMEKTQLWSHIAYVHGKSIEDTICYHCGIIIKTDQGLAKHVEKVHGKTENRTQSSDPDKPYKCSLCGTEFVQLEELRKHFRESDEHKVHRVHVKNVAKHTCSECSKCFHNKVNLEGHFNRVHAKERKYPCSRCSEAFFDSKALKVHMDVHDGLNQHKCSTCWKAFKSKFLLDRHVKTVHDKNEIYVCDTCGFKTFHAYSLTAHIQQVHQKYRPNKCDFCQDAFFYKRDKEKHMAKAHGSKETW